jgi:hypothetical protein
MARRKTKTQHDLRGQLMMQISAGRFFGSEPATDAVDGPTADTTPQTQTR